MSTLGEDNRPTRVVWVNWGYSAMIWLCVWGCLGFGMKWTGRIAYFTMVRTLRKNHALLQQLWNDIFSCIPDFYDVL